MVIDNLDLVFGALSDATRRGMLAQLSQGEMNVSALAAPHSMSQPAISKHLRVMEGAGLIERHKRGRETFVRVRPAATDGAAAWISHYSQFWKQHFDAVDSVLKAKKKRD
ncbi:MAG: metalloregulator ArsR/SmtB family transcription factor [Stappiaceae bacterium]